MAFDGLMNSQVLLLETIKYMGHPHSLNYNRETLASNFSKNMEEERMIGLILCGTSNVNMAISFMNGNKDMIKPFFENVQFCGEDSIPLIVKAINLHLL